MDRLWTPWRLGYVTEASSVMPGCIFCEALARGGDEPLLIHRGARAFVILNKFPYNNGHLMVVANRHVGRLTALDAAELSEIMTLTQAAERALDAAYRPHAYNVGLNLGKPAGAGVLDHLHMHVVPRWNGDTNFMTVVGRTRVLAEELADTAARLRPIFERLTR